MLITETSQEHSNTYTKKFPLWKLHSVVCLALPVMLTQYCLHKAQSEPEWRQCRLFWAILGSALRPYVLGGTLKWEVDKKHGHYDQHHLLLISLLHGQSTELPEHPGMDILGWQSDDVGDNIENSLQMGACGPPDSQGVWYSSEDLLLTGL